MRIHKLRGARSLQMGFIMMLVLAGCRSAPRPEPVSKKSDPAAEIIRDESQRIAETALGKQAEIIARGDLARNGLEQLLVVNKIAKAPRAESTPDNLTEVFITRASILEKRNGQWAEVLRCDEHLKNPGGYLGGAPAARVSTWRLEIRPDTKQRLEIMFTPADGSTGKEESGTVDPSGRTIVVRWNTNAKRYQSLDASHERYLSEAPTLETPQSILR